MSKGLWHKTEIPSLMFSDRNTWNLFIGGSCFSFPSLIVSHLPLHLDLVTSASIQMFIFVHLPWTYCLFGYPAMGRLLHALKYFCFGKVWPLCIGSRLMESPQCGQPWIAIAVHLILANLLAGVRLLYLQRNKGWEVIGMPPTGLLFAHSLLGCSGQWWYPPPQHHCLTPVVRSLPVCCAWPIVESTPLSQMVTSKHFSPDGYLVVLRNVARGFI